MALVLAAAAGGAINAVAGGGTLVSFPTLLFFGTAPTVANATSTLGLVVGTSGSIYGFRHHLKEVRPWLWRFAPVSLAGGLLGSWLLTRTSDRVFGKLVPFLIFFATILFVAHGFFRAVAAARVGKPQSNVNLNHTANHSPRPARSQSSVPVWGAIFFQFLVAVYGGYFGAGIGILMLATLGFIGLSNIHQMNTLKNILGSAINSVAAIWFIIAGLIDWPRAGVMVMGSLAGYWAGSHYSQRISQHRVRQIITLIGLILSALTFYQEFLRR
jgi:uncharacterized membrane protein YfcA